MDHEEVEWQFDAVHLGPVERWLHANIGARGRRLIARTGTSLVDTYLDTEDWRLFRAGCSLRIRKRPPGVEATLKSFSQPSDALRRRRELTEPLESAELETARGIPGPLGDRVRAVTGPKPLRVLFEVRTRRRIYRVDFGSHTAEIALDETTIPVDGGDPPARLRRVEVEVEVQPEEAIPSIAEFVEAMREACGLRPAVLTKFEAGLASRSLRPQTALDLGSTRVDDSCSVGEVAFAVLRKHFGAFLAKEPGTRLGDDREELHDMRVATRRLRAALALFEIATPVRAGRLRDELAWVGEALGGVRDLDVQLDQLDVWISTNEATDRQPLEALRGALEEMRAGARARLLQTLDSRRYARLVTGLSQMLAAGPLRRSPASRAPILDVAPELIRSRYRAVRKAGDRLRPDSPTADYHRLRIRCKRLRYALEFLAEVYPGQTEPAVRRLVAVQDILGLHQDSQVARQRLLAMSAEHGEELPSQTVFAMGEIAERYATQAADLRIRFEKAYGQLRGKAWKGLWRAVDRKRRKQRGPAIEVGPLPVPDHPATHLPSPGPAARPVGGRRPVA